MLERSGSFLFCYNSFFPQIHYSYQNAFEHLNFLTVISRKHYLDVFFLVNVFSGYKFCPPSLETVGIRSASGNLRDVPYFTVVFSRKNYPCARCAANTMYKKVDIFRNNVVILKFILK
jgi:hypothetical protein